MTGAPYTAPHGGKQTYAKNASFDNCYRAHYAVRRARMAGTLRPAPCEKCKDAAKEAEAHHEDYLRPLDVVWLCARCHRLRHSSIGRGETLADFLAAQKAEAA